MHIPGRWSWRTAEDKVEGAGWREHYMTTTSQLMTITSVTATIEGNIDASKWVKCKNSPRISHQLLRSNPVNNA